MSDPQKGRLFVLSGPSGVGKDSVLAKLRELGDEGRFFAVTATTRPMRAGERDGVDYIFMSEADFRRLIAEDGLLEWAEVYGNLYGVPRAQVSNALELGLDVFLKIDIQGAATVRRLYPGAVSIFLKPPDMGALYARLSERRTESAERLRLRLETARKEMNAAWRYDHRVINYDGKLDAAAAEIDAIARRETPRPD